MHELSIAQKLIELVCDMAEQADASRITVVRINVGALSCVHPDALQFCFQLVAEQTTVQGATLEVTVLPLRIYCTACRQASTLASIQNLRCPGCGGLSTEICQGRELDLVSIEVETDDLAVKNQAEHNKL